MSSAARLTLLCAPVGLVGCLKVFIDDMMLRASGTSELTVKELRDACDLR